VGCNHTKGRAEHLVQLGPQQGLRTCKPSSKVRCWASYHADTVSAACDAWEAWEAWEAREACKG